MNISRSFMMGLSLTVLTFSLAQADTLALASSPYSAIPERNVFALVPIPVAAPIDPATLKDPPPKISPNGIMSLFGQMQVLFKVAVKPLPGQPAKDASYVLAEGERQDEIQVVKIDSEKSIITFNNHGTIQELPLTEAPKGSIGPVPGSVMASSTGGIPAPVSGSSLAAARLGRAIKPDATVPAPARPATAAPSLVAGGGDGSKQIYNPAAEQLAPPRTDITPEEEIALKYLEAKAKNDPSANLLPMSDTRKKEVDGLLDEVSK